ncbi:MAG: biofilm-associated protein [Nitrosopumilus sp. H8]|nr:MAG: biofilm-associated protein [Nitrosopumilus sp. H8]
MGDPDVMMSTLQGASLLAVLLAAALAVPYAHADVAVEGKWFGSTVIIELANGSEMDITQLKMWLGKDRSILSCKAETGWTCAINPDNLAVFAASAALEPGASASFGLVTDKPVPSISWRALDGEADAGSGTVAPGKESSPAEQPDKQSDPPGEPAASGPAFGEGYVFRIVPESPNVGSTIRVVGQSLGALQPFDFYIGSEKSGTFRTDETGSFVGTARISEDQSPGRVNFKLSAAEEEKEISRRIGDVRTRAQPVEVDLTLSNAPSIVHRGDEVNISGTGRPDGAIAAEIRAPDGAIINSMIANIGPDGTWGVGESITIPLDAEFGLYTATITDGRQEIVKQWRVESNQVIDIKPVRLRYTPGDDMEFRGTGPSDAQLIVTMEDPEGREISSDVITTDGRGSVFFKFPTTRTTDVGTYTLIVTLGSEKEFIYVGLGLLPSTPINLEMDRFHYESDATAVITLSGSGSDTLNLLIVEDSNNKEIIEESVILKADGRGTYSFELEGFKSTVYTAIVKKGNIQSEEKFGVNLKKNPSDLTVHTTKEKYLPGESILITGNTMESRKAVGSKSGPATPVCPNEASIYLVIITLVNPDGEDTRQKSSFANKKCQVSDKTFRVPTDAKPGMWAVRADSGAKSAITEFEVPDIGKTGIQISVEEGQGIEGQQKGINIHVTGGKQTVIITIASQDGDVIDTLQFPANDDGEVSQPWLIPVDIEPGTYTFSASYDRKNFAETTYEIGDE